MADAGDRAAETSGVPAPGGPDPERQTPPAHRPLQVRGLAAGYGDRVVFSDVTFGLPGTGLFGLLGPSGAGKSTLLRTLSRWNDPLGSFWRRGRVLLDGRDLMAEPDPEGTRAALALLVQKSRLFTADVLENAIAQRRGSARHAMDHRGKVAAAREVLEPWSLWEELKDRLDEPVVALPIGVQRRLAIARMLDGGPRYLLLDEPERDLPDGQRRRMAAMLRKVGRHLPVLLCTHQQSFAREVCAQVGLLAGGRLLEWTGSERFFTEPKTPEGRDFIRLGNCWPKKVPTGEAPDPEAAAEAARVDAPPAAPGDAVGLPRGRRPSELHWIIPEALAGCQQPGLLNDLDAELTGLRELGCDLLVNLRHEASPDEERLAAHGIESWHFPIVDMEAPEVAPTRALCARLWEEIDAGRCAVLHCKAGLGRTGTLLACLLVHRGTHPVNAVDQVRTVNPRYIQSDVQLRFVERFAKEGTGGPSS